MRNFGAFSLLAALLLGAVIAEPVRSEDSSDTTSTKLISLDDYNAITYPNSPTISPNGDTISYGIDGQIFLMSADGEQSIPVTSADSNAWGTLWSTDGDSIYFQSDRGDNIQIYQLPINGVAEAVQVTHFENGVASMNMSADKSRVLLAVSDNDLLTPAEDAGPQPIVVTRRHFKTDSGNGYIVDGDSNHLYIYDIASHEMMQLSSGRYDESGAAWSPDGESIVFVSNREQEPGVGHRTDLWLVASDASEGEPELVRLTNSERPKYNPMFSPDGNQIAYLSASNGIFGIYQITLVSTTGGEPRILSANFDHWVETMQYSSDGKWIVFTYVDSGTTALGRVRVSDGKVEKLVEGDQVIHSFDISNGNDIVLIANGQNDSAEVYKFANNNLSQLSNLNRAFFNQRKLGEKSKISFENADGIRIDTFITTPPDYEPGRMYPAILRVHGGPQDQFTWGFNFSAQFYASKGYVVIEPNPRGSTGRGEEFLGAIYRSWGVPDYEDVVAAVDYAIENDIADPDRLVVTGYSYGGYMTNVVITETERFKAAASGAGHSLIEANVGHDIYQRWYMWELGEPWENREKYDVHSPLLRAGKVVTPTLFLGGSIDWNVPLLNAELFYQALKFRNIDTQLVIYPDVHHGGWPIEFEKDYLERVVAWFDLYVKTAD